MGATGSLRRTSTLLARRAAGWRSGGLSAGLAATLRIVLRWRADRNLRSILQLVKSVDGDNVARLDSLNLRHGSVGDTRCDGMDGSRLVRADHIDKSPLG